MACATLQAGSVRIQTSSAQLQVEKKTGAVSVACTPRASPLGSSISSTFCPRIPLPSSPVTSSTPRVSSAQLVQVRNEASIEFIRGVKELTVPEVRLTRSRDGSSGTATFIFDQPSVFEQSTELGDITGLYMIDEEGVMQSVEVSARFVNGRPSAIEARYIMRSEREWDRFMRFMERYAEENGLGFTKK